MAGTEGSGIDQDDVLASPTSNPHRVRKFEFRVFVELEPDEGDLVRHIPIVANDEALLIMNPRYVLFIGRDGDLGTIRQTPEDYELRAGADREGLIARVTTLYDRLGEAGREEYQDVVASVLDSLTGFSSPSAAL